MQDAIDVVCVAQSSSGDPALGPRRRRAYELLDLVEPVLAALVSSRADLVDAKVIEHTYRPLRDGAGTSAIVDFTIQLSIYRKV